MVRHTLALLDELPGYFESRASAWDKIRTKTSKESKTSKSSSEDTGGKVGSTKVLESMPPCFYGTHKGVAHHVRCIEGGAALPLTIGDIGTRRVQCQASATTPLVDSMVSVGPCILHNDGNHFDAVGCGYDGGRPKKLSPWWSRFCFLSGCRTPKQVRGPYT